MRTIVYILITLAPFLGNAQSFYATSASIVYNKTTNERDSINSVLKDYSCQPIEPGNSKWILVFNDSMSLYQVQKDKKPNSVYDQWQFKTYLFSDLNKNYRFINREYEGKTAVFEDTIPTIKWKLIHETRKIANFNCRKALGVINDSIYIVAFYAEELLFEGGPEGITGLPGTILGLAIPRFGLTWFAESVDLNYRGSVFKPAESADKNQTIEKNSVELINKNQFIKKLFRSKVDVNDIDNKLFGYIL